MALTAVGLALAVPSAGHAESDKAKSGGKHDKAPKPDKPKKPKSSDKAPKKPAPKKTGPVIIAPGQDAMVQLLPMLAPVAKKAASGELLPVSIFLGVKGPDDAQKACQEMSRIRDAIVGLLYEQPIPMGRNGPDPLALDKPLKDAVNAVLPGRFITTVRLMESRRAAEPGFEKSLPAETIMQCANKPTGGKSGGKEKGGGGGGH
ncbi:MAG: hypothetical protein H7840_09495 [Alphaproteobacteria bacterium]